MKEIATEVFCAEFPYDQKEHGLLSHDEVKPDMVNHPPHYERANAIECIDEMELVFGPNETAIFCKLNAWKYRYRAADKNGAEDIKKSDWYMRKFKEIKERTR